MQTGHLLENLRARERAAKRGERPCSGAERGREITNEGIKLMNQNQPDNATEPRSVDQQQACSLLVDCTEDKQTFTARKPHNRLHVWKGRDFWHQDISVQVRLEPDGRIYLSTQEGHVSTLRAATITIEQLHALIRGVTANA